VNIIGTIWYLMRVIGNNLQIIIAKFIFSIRNPASQLFESVCAVKCSHRLILSGTPVQNSPADLWALFTLKTYLKYYFNF